MTRTAAEERATTRDRDGVAIEPMRTDDLPAAAEVEERSARRPRTEAAMRADFESNPLAWYCVARRDVDAEPTVIGYACLWRLADEAHVVMLAVLPEWRRRGIGGRLLRRLVEQAERMDMACVTLEVRETNEAAKRLYAGHGFEVVGVRPRYYPDTGETAVIMTAPVVRRETAAGTTGRS